MLAQGVLGFQYETEGSRAGLTFIDWLAIVE